MYQSAELFNYRFDHKGTYNKRLINVCSKCIYMYMYMQPFCGCSVLSMREDSLVFSQKDINFFFNFSNSAVPSRRDAQGGRDKGSCQTGAQAEEHKR